MDKSKRNFLVTLSVCTMSLTSVGLARATWIQSSPLQITVNAQGEGRGEIQAQNGRATFTIVGALPAFVLNANEAFVAQGEAYFLDSLASFEGRYLRIEQNIETMSIDGVRGGIKLQNQSGIVIYMTGPSDVEQFNPQIQEILIVLDQESTLDAAPLAM